MKNGSKRRESLVTGRGGGQLWQKITFSWIRVGIPTERLWIMTQVLVCHSVCKHVYISSSYSQVLIALCTLLIFFFFLIKKIMKQMACLWPFPFSLVLLFASLVLNCEISEVVGAWRTRDVSSVPGSVEGAVHSLATPCDGVCCLLLRLCVWRISGFLSAAYQFHFYKLRIRWQRLCLRGGV